jgi:hypothetical protein
VKEVLPTSNEIAQQVMDGITLPDYPELLQLATDYKRLEQTLRACAGHMAWALSKQEEESGL